MSAKKNSFIENTTHKTAEIEVVNKILADQEMELLLNTAIPWETLGTQISDKESLEQLIIEVHEAVRKDENIAQLKSRLESLGSNVMRVAKKVYFLLE